MIRLPTGPKVRRTGVITLHVLSDRFHFSIGFGHVQYVRRFSFLLYQLFDDDQSANVSDGGSTIKQFQKKLIF